MRKVERAIPMIIVQLKGGLGNQMFQYAAGRRLACLHNVSLKLDLSWLDKEQPGVTTRPYALGPFSIEAEAATDKEIAKLWEPKYDGVRRIINVINPLYRPTHIREQQFHFDSAILGLPDNIYLDGYWQSEKYFRDIAPVIRRDFTVRAEADGPNREVAAVINGCNAVSIHFRRGDYTTNTNISAQHGVCADDYYKKAVDLLAARTERPHFFVFSDDPLWVQEHFTIPHPMTVIAHNGPDQAHEDLRLMSLCRHHIIANSSFSWWGAWLAENLHKTVIAPARWFDQYVADTRDLFPEEWLKI